MTAENATPQQPTTEQQKPTTSCATGFVKLYGEGRMSISFDVPQEYLAAATKCVEAVASSPRVTVDGVRLGQRLADAGVPQDAINTVVGSLDVDDDIYLSPPSWSR
jgi:hypothetical protein